MTEPQSLAAGDVVQMRSGGPLMTVRSVNTFEPALRRGTTVTECWCEWFETSEGKSKRHGEGEKGYFLASLLEKVK